jgi:hypothetical protein
MNRGVKIFLSFPRFCFHQGKTVGCFIQNSCSFISLMSDACIETCYVNSRLPIGVLLVNSNDEAALINGEIDG